MREAEVAVFVARRARSEILLVHRCAELGDYWHTVAGGIEPGEEPVDAARRELAEETGLAIEELGRVDLRAYPLTQEPPEARERYAPGLEEVPVHAYLVDAPDDWEPMLDWEHDGHQWLAPAEAATAFRWPETRDALVELLSGS